MARLNQPPRAHHEAARQRPPSPPLASDAATEPSRLSPAVLGANLLNAARVDYRHSSPVRMARRPGHGRLSRVGAFTEPRRMDFSRPRENVWDLPESPVGRAFKLSERVNRAPLKKRKKPNAEPAPVLPSSPPQVGPQTDHEGDVDIVARLPNGTRRCAATSYRWNAAAGPRYEQCHNTGTQNTPQGSRCTRHARKSGPVRCEHLVPHDDGSAQCTAAGVNGTTRCAKHMKTLNSGDNAEKRKSGSTDATSDGGDEPPKRAKKSRVQKSPAKVPRSSVEDDLVETIEHGRPSQSNPLSHVQAKSKLPNGKPKDLRHTGPRNANRSAKSTKSSGPDEHGDEALVTDDLGEHDTDVNEASEEATKSLGPFERVFDFLALERRPGRCQTQLCLDVKSACDRMRSWLSKESPSLDDAAEKTRDIQNLLLKICRVDEDDRRAVKGDMYGHVFRSLIRLLRALYEYLAEEREDMMASPECIRILSHFVHDILAAKGWVADWKIRWNSDRMIKDVDSFLIAPLRDAQMSLTKHLRKLEKEQQERRTLLDFRSQYEEEDEDTAEKASLQEARNKRYDHWHQLHITRMDVEPDPYRRRTVLWFTKLEELGETDANGITFERLPVFKNRKTPPLRKTPSAPDAATWSTAQETALIDGLQEFSGPNVFHAIFRGYCQPGGLLRDFSVRDIVTKAEWIRSLYTKHYQERGWQEPGWMVQNPTFF